MCGGVLLGYWGFGGEKEISLFQKWYHDLGLSELSLVPKILTENEVTL